MKAQALVHYSYVITENKLMLLDIQGSGYTLYDPEIATEKLMANQDLEIYFCSGNCSTVAYRSIRKWPHL